MYFMMCSNFFSVSIYFLHRKKRFTFKDLQIKIKKDNKPLPSVPCICMAFNKSCMRCFPDSPRGKRTYNHAAERAEAFKSKRDLSCSISEAQNQIKQKRKISCHFSSAKSSHA